MTTQKFDLTKQASKEEEINFLTKIVASVEPGTYLSSLFTKDLLDHVSYLIKNDMDCNVIAEYRRLQDLNADYVYKIESDQGRHERELKKCRDAREQVLDENEQLSNDIDQILDENEQLSNDIDQMRQKLQEANALAQKNDADWMERHNSTVNLLEKAHQTIADRDTMITRLKARMFDLLEKIEQLEEIAEYGQSQPH